MTKLKFFTFCFLIQWVNSSLFESFQLFALENLSEAKKIETSVLAPTSSQNKNSKKEGYFKGRVAKINKLGEIIRVRTEFGNLKFINRSEKVEIFASGQSLKRCQSYVVAKSPENLLLKIPNMEECSQVIPLSVGATLQFFSNDLVNNLVKAQELVEVLQKKYLALTGIQERHKNQLQQYLEKMEAVNLRYQILRDKLQLEWQNELSVLQNEKLSIMKNFNSAEFRLNELKLKLEQYKIIDSEQEWDRWSLDSRLYFKK
jgi:hypothetical protein